MKKPPNAEQGRALKEGDFWCDVELSLKHDEFPKDEHLVAALRGSLPVPPEVREFLAKVIEGKFKKPVGRNSSIHDRMELGLGRDANILTYFEAIIDEIKQAPKESRTGTPSEEAYDEIQQLLDSENNMNVSISTIRNVINADNRRKRLGTPDPTTEAVIDLFLISAKDT